MLSLSLSPDFSPDLVTELQKVLSGLPILTGRPISVSADPDLTSFRGKLLSGKLDQGTPVHAASFIRKRKIVLESSLLNPSTRDQTLQFILVHELFHFVWSHLSNRLRAHFNSLLQDERQHGARGGLGESSEFRQLLLARDVSPSLQSWREYVCESFCDTAGWLYTSVCNGSGRLRPRWREQRRNWFATAFAHGCRC